MGTRVLVLSADIGEGHLTAARSLTESLREHAGIDAVELRTDLSVMGPRLGRFLTRGFDTHLGRIGWTYELAYRVFFERELPRRAGQLVLAMLGGRGLRNTIAAYRADVVVTEYPLLSAALGELRLLGRMQRPVCSSISDPAGLYYWAHPGVDMHLLSWPESLAEVERIAGADAATIVRPMIDRRFLARLDRAQSREQLGLPLEPPVVVVSGGGWGMGDLSGAVEIAREVVGDGLVLVVAGHNQSGQSTLTAGFARDPKVRVLGFTDQMPALLGAADALIHTTGGTTALEARAVGCPLINYGTGVAHVRAHARALSDLGLAEWAQDRSSLGPALRRALRSGRRPALEVDELPLAADVILEVAGR